MRRNREQLSKRWRFGGISKTYKRGFGETRELELREMNTAYCSTITISV
jgi:hypothetical protein